MNISGKNAIVTGGVGGIGIALVRELLRNGAQAIGIYDLEDPTNITATLQNEFPLQKVIFEAVDVRDSYQLRNAFNKFIKLFKFIDIVFGNAGIFNELDPVNTIAVNLNGVINTTYEAIPLMSKSTEGRGGLIVNTASIAALSFLGGMAVYTASKHGVYGFTTSMANEVNATKHGIHFITICPGLTETPFVNGVTSRFRPDYADSFEKVTKKMDLQKPEDFAKHAIEAVKRNQNGSVTIVENNTSLDHKTVNYMAKFK